MVSQIKSTSGDTHNIVDRSEYEKVYVDTSVSLNDFKTPGTYVFYADSQSGNVTQQTFRSPTAVPVFPCFVKVEKMPQLNSNYKSVIIQRYTTISTFGQYTYYRKATYGTSSYSWDSWSNTFYAGDLNRDDAWDGLDSSLNATLGKKKDLDPSVISFSSVNLDIYTTSGTYILTGLITTKTNFPVSTPGQLEVTRWSESSSSYFCRQEFKVYDKAYRFQNDSFTRMGTSSNGTTWDWGPWGSDQYFISGETFTLGSGYSMYGHITSSTTRIYIYTVLPKSLRYVNITKPTSTISIDVRQNGKYVQANPYSFTIDSLGKFGDAQQPCGIEIGLKNANGTALTNGTNNDTVTAQLRANLSLSFTARTL